jgi:predicted PurR-regulated permease PerM
VDEPRVSTSKVLILAAAAALLFVFREVLWPLALALVLGTLIAALSRRLHAMFPKAGHKAITIATAVVVVAVVVGSMLVVVEGLSQIIAKAPAMYRRVDQIVAAIRLPGVAPINLGELARRLDLPVIVGRALGGMRGAVSGLVLTVLYLVFLLASARRIERRLDQIVAARSNDRLVNVMARSVRSVEAYTYIQTVTGLIMSVAIGAVMLALGLENALFWSLLFFLLSFLPIVGVAVGSVGPTLFAVLQFPTLAPAIAIFLWIQAVAFVVGNLVLPKMQADTQNIDPAASLLAIGVWTILWGVPGAFLAIPLTLVMMYALAQYPSTHWIAVLISNDGSPTPPDGDLGEIAGPDHQPRMNRESSL